MANQDRHNIPEPDGQSTIPASGGFQWWGWIWFIVGIVVFVWLLGWGWVI